VIFWWIFSMAPIYVLNEGNMQAEVSSQTCISMTTYRYNIDTTAIQNMANK